MEKKHVTLLNKHKQLEMAIVHKTFSQSNHSRISQIEPTSPIALPTVFDFSDTHPHFSERVFLLRSEAEFFKITHHSQSKARREIKAMKSRVRLSVFHKH